VGVAGKRIIDAEMRPFLVLKRTQKPRESVGSQVLMSCISTS
jgi:hypothetical protein